MPVRQLSEGIVNRIAAGEVVERPASVVKELIENALDAGASRIEIAIEGGGRRRILVADDGHGMVRPDLQLAVERHATSKLDNDDLLAIHTLGFRGEALPSIGAVARLCLATRHADEPHGWTLSVEGGAKSECKPAPLSAGTRVEVRDLFYATPARLKFLKSDRSETEAVREVVRRLAMSRPDVAFTLGGEDRGPISYPAALPGSAGRLARLADVLGSDFRANAVEVRGALGGVGVEGFAALPTLTRFGIVSRRKQGAIVDRFMQRLGIKATSADQRIRELSGGNQQKVLLARWLATDPKLLILDEPTRGIDIGAKGEIQHLVNELAATGLGVLMISSELEELVEGSSRVVVLRDGRNVAELTGDEISQQAIIRAMASEDAAAAAPATLAAAGD